MEVKLINDMDELWESTIQYAENCSWGAEHFLAGRMKNKKFTDWERVLVALENNTIAGYCTLIKTDCIPEVSYTPYISHMFVGENFRGNRISEKLILCALKYAKELGFQKVYLVSDHVNLYEKYDFVKIDEKLDLWGRKEKIYMHET
jgi:Acetyltransferases